LIKCTNFRVLGGGTTVFYSESQCDFTYLMALYRLETHIKIIFIENSIPKTTLSKVAFEKQFFEEI
jgi:hypothetical protein